MFVLITCYSQISTRDSYPYRLRVTVRARLDGWSVVSERTPSKKFTNPHFLGMLR